VAAVEVLVANSRVREMIEDKDRTKEIPQAIAQSHVTYGMQTFDQSLMQLFRQNIISYEEALRQSSNPDDFALRVSGISATSDSTWDDFDKKEEAQQQATGKSPARPAAGAPRPAAANGRPGSPPAAKPAAKPAATPAAGSGDDDFQIERF